MMVKKYKFILTLSILIIFLINTSNYVFAENLEQNNNDTIVLNDDNTVYIDNVVNTGKDNGFSKIKNIENGDPHYGWKLGKFAITDFSSKRKDSNENWILLKNVNDKVSLYFILSQDINKLDGNDKLAITEDKNGYDNEFNVKKSNFGKGMLIVRKIDASGNKNEPVLYRDYLNGVTVGATTQIDVFEEGDYEVALDYEVRDNGLLFFDNYENYRIRFNFSVRNGNCMVFPFDVKTKNELNNTSITEHGFYLDLANSKYLSVNIKKEVLKDGNDGLVEDIRFNRPAKSGEEYTEEGIYTITAKNEYTSEVTIKKIYVGKNKLLKAHVQNSDYSISELKSMVSKGANIDENGNLSNIPLEYQEQASSNFNSINTNLTTFSNYLPVAVPLILLALFIVYKLIKRKKENELTKIKIKQKEGTIEENEEIMENFDNNEKNNN